MALLTDIRKLFSRKDSPNHPDPSEPAEGLLNIYERTESTASETQTNITDSEGVSVEAKPFWFREDQPLEEPQSVPLNDVTTLSERLDKQAEQLELISELINTSLRELRSHNENLTNSVTELREAAMNSKTDLSLKKIQERLEEVVTSNRQTVDILSDLSHTNELRETQFRTATARRDKIAVAALIACGAATITAIGLSIFVLASTLGG